ncbi:hypothetical protein ABIB40_004097 [Pedobacter sp. UYP30]|uniref:hypothetical protein n=1 Tax=Pedobacter sp. UYP30 TaxID=1756400 RepID=UPI003396FDA3
MVEIYKTNVTNQKDASEIIRKLNEHFPYYKINFDLEDCDKILRVESLKKELEIEGIIKLIRNIGFDIELLPDEVISFGLEEKQR